MFSYIRRNMVAFVALFIAIISLGSTSAYAINSIRSADIVDGQVKNQDIGDNAVGNRKIQDNSVIGADINESTLGQVPNAKSVDGIGLGALQHQTRTARQKPASCYGGDQIWVACAPITVTVPAGHSYVVTLTSTLDAVTGTSQSLVWCPAYTGPTCISGSADGITLLAGNFTTGTQTATGLFPAGTYTFNTAAKFAIAVADRDDTHISTTIDYYDFLADKKDP